MKESESGGEKGSATDKPDKASQDRKAMFNVAPNTGLSGRNLYFN